MCLACEMDALWFAEMEMAAPGSAGVPPAVSAPSPRLRGEVGMSAFFALIPGEGASPRV